MSEAFRFDYYYGAESDQFSFVRIPKLLLKDPKFANLSHGAIITYAVLLDRMNLSIKNGWHDEYNRVYIRYKVTDLTDVIGKSDDTVSKYLKELEDIGLIERPRKGLGRGKVTYVKNFISPELRDGDLIPRENAGNGKNDINAKSDLCTIKVENSGQNESLEAAKLHIPRENAGNVTRDISGNVPRINAGNISRENAVQNNNDLRDKESINNNLYLNHISDAVKSIRPDRDDDWMLYKATIKENIDYDALCQRSSHGDKEEIDGLVDIMSEVMVSKAPFFWIASCEYPANLVRGKFMKIDSTHIEYVLDCFHKNTSKIYNIKKYLLAALFNAPSTIDSYYRAEANHDLYGF